MFQGEFGCIQGNGQVDTASSDRDHSTIKVHTVYENTFLSLYVMYIYPCTYIPSLYRYEETCRIFFKTRINSTPERTYNIE